MDIGNISRKEILKYTEIAYQAWESLSVDSQNILKKDFLIRPTNSGINIISTLPSHPMRGLEKYIKKKVDLLLKFTEILSKTDELSCTDSEIIRKTMKTIGFSYRDKSNKIQLEEGIQASMIKRLPNDNVLKEKLNAKSPLKYIASEFIFEDGCNRVDIIGFDGNDLFLFELKKKSQTSCDQVKGYVFYYSSPIKREILSDILKLYPINNVPSFNNIRGVMVMPGSKNSPYNWANLSKDNSIDILRFDNEYNWI